MRWWRSRTGADRADAAEARAESAEGRADAAEMETRQLAGGDPPLRRLPPDVLAERVAAALRATARRRGGAP